MEITIFLSKALGVYCVIIALTILSNKAMYRSVLKSFASNQALLYLSGFLALGLGLMIVLLHNTWNTGPEVIISLIGWIVLLKGVVRLAFPAYTARMLAAAEQMKDEYVVLLAYGIIILGTYLTYQGFWGI